jgi:excisionase family DNA binding protein
MSGDLQLASRQPVSHLVGKVRKSPRAGSSDLDDNAEQAGEHLPVVTLDHMPPGDEPWLRYSGAAQVLGISRGTLEVWLSTRRYSVPHYKIGRNVLFKRSELLAWLESRRRGGDAHGE